MRYLFIIFGTLTFPIEPNGSRNASVSIANLWGCKRYASPKLSMDPFCVTRSNSTHQLTDPTQPNPLQVEKSPPNRTQPDPWVNPTHGSTRPMGQPNPWVNPTHGQLCTSYSTCILACTVSLLTTHSSADPALLQM